MQRYLTSVFRHTVHSALLMIAVCSGCASSTQLDDRQDSAGKVRAVCTVGMVAELVRNVGGENVVVDQLMGSGVDPHLYKATRDDVAVVLSGDIVFYCGLLLEGKMSDVLGKLSKRQHVIAVTNKIDRASLLSASEAGDEFDPHVWMDVSLWSQSAEAVMEELSKLDPTNSEAYRSNLDHYQEQLQRLHSYATQSIASIPKESRILITSHDAFSYLGRAYGLEVVGVQGLSTESEAGLQQINHLVDMLVDRNIKSVFVESSVSEKNIMALIDGAKSRGHTINVGAELFSDAMGATGTYEGTYIGMIDHNITNIVRALGGNAPERGFQGLLAIEHAHE